VWGPKAFAAGSSLARPPKLAAYISTTMGSYVGSITAEQARDVAAFLDAQPRPGR
jgi:cytochrome c